MIPLDEQLFSLNPQQRQAVECTEGRLLILAGAGSGKTKVLTLRMAYLINRGISPSAILGLTFTNKAAKEMKDRVGQLVGKKGKEVTLCTFHSFCMTVLRKHIHKLGYTSQFTLYDEKDVLRLIKQIARDSLEIDGELPSLEPTIKAIAHAQNNALDPKSLSDTGSEWHDEFARDVFSKYKQYMRAYNAVDFDSLLTLALDLFRRFPEVLEEYHHLYRYIMIDEYQDTNHVQFQLATLLSQKFGNLCVVGDDDQSIYGWRGAEVRNILEFPADATVKLEQNYRSTNTILKAANEVIAKNSSRHGKKLWSAKGEGEKIELFFAPGEIQEAEAIVARLVQMRKEKALKWKECALLYRSNSLARPLEAALRKQVWQKGEGFTRGIPYRVFGGQEFYERKEVRDLAAYLRVIVNPLDQEAFLRVINQPRRGIGEKGLDLLTAKARRLGIPVWEIVQEVLIDPKEIEISERCLGGLRQFVSLIQHGQALFKEKSFSTALAAIVDRTDFKRAIAEEVKSEKMRKFKWENIQEFLKSAKEWEEEQANASLPDFLEQVQLDNSFSQKRSLQQEDSVSLMTFHSSKGLEFPVVFLVGVEDHIIPHEKSMEDTGIEEERRLMYVAITRAKERLVISMSKQRGRMGKMQASRPSRFLSEIPKEFLFLNRWDAL